MQLYQDQSPAALTRIVIDQITYLIALNYGVSTTAGAPTIASVVSVQDSESWCAFASPVNDSLTTDIPYWNTLARTLTRGLVYLASYSGNPSRSDLAKLPKINVFQYADSFNVWICLDEVCRLHTTYHIILRMQGRVSSGAMPQYSWLPRRL